EGEQSLGAAEEATRLAGGRGGPGGLVAPYLFACGQIEQYDASEAAAAIGQQGSRRSLADDDAFGTHGSGACGQGARLASASCRICPLLLSMIQRLPLVVCTTRNLSSAWKWGWKRPPRVSRPRSPPGAHRLKASWPVLTSRARRLRCWWNM